MTDDIIHRVRIPLAFPEGIRPGAGKDGGNRLVLDCDGQGRPVLRGTALAGALRHAYARRLGVASVDPEVCRWFGQPCDADDGLPSPLRVADTVLRVPQGQPVRRFHNGIDRHRGSVREGVLVELEALPPGTAADAVLILAVGDALDAEAPAFLAALVALLDGLTLGGSAARGIGRAAVAGPVQWRRFDRRRLEDEAAWLDEASSHRHEGGTALPAAAPVDDDTRVLTVRCVLAIPRGQDLCIGNGQALDHEIEPQRVADAQGRLQWRLPGSSLRGVFRAWMHRLAAREGKLVDDPARPRSDTLPAHRERPASGADLLWGRASAQQRAQIQDALAGDPSRLAELVPCPLMRLFGSGYSKGRIHISDAIAEAKDGEQARMHVAVDRITGGANEGFLFSNTVLADPRLRFAVTIRIEDPTADEARWLAATLRALDLGLIRVGSSKAAGRLALAEPPQACGPHHALFTALRPSQELP